MNIFISLLYSYTNIFMIVLLAVVSLIVNLLQICVYLLSFFGHSMKSRLEINQYLANLWWDLILFWIECINNTKVVWTGDPLPKQENAVMIGNHNAGLDFVSAIMMATQADVGTGHTMALLKESLRYMPAIGWMNYFQGSLFMNRTWEKDEKNLTLKLRDIISNNYPEPYWVALYPEGTRITESKRKESWIHAEANNLPKLTNVLIPRSKGFLFVLRTLDTHFDALYDVTIGYDKAPLFIYNAVVNGGFKTKAVHLNVRRIKREDLPKGEESLKKWLLDAFIEKDKLLQQFYDNGQFPNTKIYQPPNVERFMNLFYFWSSVCLILSFLTTPLWFSFAALFASCIAFYRASSNIDGLMKNTCDSECLKESNLNNKKKN